MPAQRSSVQKYGGKGNDGYARAVYTSITSAENRSLVTAMGLFAVRALSFVVLSVGSKLTYPTQAGVAFLHSSYSEILLPP